MHDRKRHSEAMEAYLKHSLAAILKRLHYHENVGKYSMRQAFDYVYESPLDQLHVVAKILGKQFPSAAKGKIADAILEMRHFLEQDSCPPQARGMLAIMVPGPASIPSIVEYIGRHAPQLDSFLLDSRGYYELHLRRQRECGQVPPMASELLPSAPARNPSRGRLFAPKFQWLLKILLLNGFEPEYWGGPAVPPRNVSELAKAGGVSQPYASKFVAAAVASDYLERSPEGFILRRIDSLLEEWAAAARLKPQGRHLHVAPMFPLDGQSLHEAILKRLRSQQKADGSPKAVIGGHFACELMNLDRSNIKSALIYIDGRAEEFLSAWDLAEVAQEMGHLDLVEPASKQSIFAGHGLAQGIPICDIIQCYLDVRWSPARGREQADFIYERVLGPRLKKRRPGRF